MLLGDVGDAASLAAMARQTRLVLSCVGPVSAVMARCSRGVRRARLPALRRSPAGACGWAPRGGESCRGCRETCRWASEFQELSR